MQEKKAEEGVKDNKRNITETQRLSRKIFALFLSAFAFSLLLALRFLSFPLPSLPFPLHKIFLADTIQIHSFDYDFSADKSIISSPNVSGELQTHLFNSLFGVSRRNHRSSTRGSRRGWFWASKLAYYCFMVSGERNKTLGSKTKVLITHSTASSVSIKTLMSVPLHPKPHKGEMDGQVTCLHMQWIMWQERDTEF